MKHIKEIGKGKECRKCNRLTLIRTKKGKIKPKNYYSQWEYCRFCKAVFFDKKYKVYGT